MYRTLILFVFFLVPICLLGQIERGTPVANVSTSATSQPNTYAIVVGISNYAEVKDLEFADRDAIIFAQYLEKDMGIPHKNIKLFVNEEATRFNIVDEIYRLNEIVTPNDKVYFYFAGHGDLEAKIDKENALLLLHKSLKISYLKGYDYISLIELHKYLDNLIEKKAQVIFIADACHSGGLIGGVEGQEKTASALVSEWKNQTKIVSCQPNESSIESKEWGGGRGLFSFHLIEGLQGLADADVDSTVTLFEIQNYTQTEVRKQSSPIKQTPIVYGDLDQTLSKVNYKSLQFLLAQKAKNYPVLATINSKGTEAELLEKVDSTTLKYYHLFTKSLQSKAFSIPENDCAYYYLQKIIPDRTNAELLRILKRNFAAALQEKALIIINQCLNYEENFERVSQYEYLLASKELQLAQALLGNSHYLYSNIEARIFFLKVCSNFYNLRGTLYIDKDEDKLIKENISLLQQSIKLEPNVPYSYQFLILLYSIQGNLSELEKCLLDYLSIFRNDAKVFNLLGVYYLEKKDYSKAEINLKKSIELNPKLYSSYVVLGNLYHSLKRTNEALISAQKAIELNKYDVDSYLLLTKIYDENGQKNKALEISNIFDQLTPTDVDNSNKLGVLYLQKRNYEKAILYFNKSLNLNSKISETYFYLGLAYFKSQKYSKSIEYYKKYITLKPNDNLAYTELASAYNKVNQYDNSIKCFEKVISLDSSLLNSEHYSTLGRLYVTTNQIGKSVKVFQRAIKLNPNYSEVYKYLGVVLVFLKQFNEAEENLKKAISLNSKDLTAHKYLGDLYKDTKNNYKLAEEIYKKGLKENPKDKDLLTGLAYNFIAKKEYEEAETIFKKALDVDNTNPSTYYDLCCLFSIQNKPHDALSWFEQALQKGYKEYEHIQTDTDLNNIRQLTEFMILMEKYFPEKK